MSLFSVGDSFGFCWRLLRFVGDSRQTVLMLVVEGRRSATISQWIADAVLALNTSKCVQLGGANPPLSRKVREITPNGPVSSTAPAHAEKVDGNGTSAGQIKGERPECKISLARRSPGVLSFFRAPSKTAPALQSRYKIRCYRSNSKGKLFSSRFGQLASISRPLEVQTIT